MTALHEAALELVRRTRHAQGLPERVSDPVVLARLAGLFGERPTPATAPPTEPKKAAA